MNLNTLLDPGPIALWILIVGLFFPRFTLFAAWLAGVYPSNTVPPLITALAWSFVPRFLMAYYVYTDIGSNSLWFCIYLVVGLASLLGEGGYVRHRIIRRTTVREKGRTVTTIEEEN